MMQVGICLLETGDLSELSYKDRSETGIWNVTMVFSEKLDGCIREMKARFGE